MRILLVCPAYYGFELGLCRALESLGHSVTLLSYFAHDTNVRRVWNRLSLEVAPRVGFARLRSERVARFNERIAAVARHTAPDCLLVVKGEIIDPDVVRTLSDSCLALYWAPDDPFRYPHVLSALKHYAVVASFSEADTCKLRLSGCQAHYVPNGYSDHIFAGDSVLARSECRQVSFVGARYPEREHLLQSVIPCATLGIWGGDWKPRPWRVRFYQRRTFARSALQGWANLRKSADIYRSCSINLNVHGSGWDGLNTRVFEIPGAGGFQLCDARPGIESMFVPGKEIAVFRDEEELIEMIAYFLQHDNHRERIRNAGRTRARRDHTLTRRLSELLSLAK